MPPLCTRCGEPWRWPFHVCAPRWRYALALPFALLALVLSLGCVPAQVRVAHALAIAGAGLEKPMRAVETTLGEQALRDVHARGGTREEGDAALASLEARWAPAWAALDLFLSVDDAWLVALQAGESGDFGELLGAACRLLDAATPLAPEALGRFSSVVGGLCQ